MRQEPFDDWGEGGPGQQYPGAPPYGQPPPPPPRRRMSRRGLVILIVAICLVVAGSLVGAGFVVDRLLFPPKEDTEEFSITGSEVYREAVFDIKNYYYNDYDQQKLEEAAQEGVEDAREEGVTDSDELLDAGMRRMMESLGDDHSVYLTPGENKRLGEDLSGSFFGVGFTLRLDEEKEMPEVVSVLKGSPAEKAGIKGGDIILSVDGQSTEGLTLDNVVLRIRGKEGTKVDLEIERKGEKEPLGFEITREKIEIPDFESEMMDGRYGYLRTYEFNSGVSEKVREAVGRLQDQGAQGFILDLRNDPGGLLDEAVKLSSVFLDEGTVVSYQTKEKDPVTEPASGDPATDLPLVVLVNRGSASSSEIVAGALKQHGRAILVGTSTFGKGSVQKVYDLDNGGAVKLTVALYYLPDGDSIEGRGIEPNVVVELEEDPDTEDQLQLDKAKEVLQNLIEGKPPTGALLRPAA